MDRKLKPIGLALAALLAVAALSASVASAYEFHSETSEVELNGENVGETVWTFKSGTVKCTAVTYKGTMTNVTSEEMVLVPAFTGCKAFGFLNATADVNGCELKSRPDKKPMLLIDCPDKTTIVITAVSCWVTIPEQGVEGGITSTTKGFGVNRDVELGINLGALTYTHHPQNFPGCEKGVFGDALLQGTATVKAKKAGEQVGLWWE